MDETTIFNFSIAELCQRGDKVLLSFARNEDAFQSYGYNTATSTAMKAAINHIKEFPSDDYYQGLQKMATESKNNARVLLENNIADLRNRAKLVYGPKSTEYGLFTFGRLSSLTDNELVQFALHVCQIAEPRIDKLAERMVTADNIEIIKADRIKLDNLIDAQGMARTERREKKLERIVLCNQLYKQISELSEVGKLIWKGKNEAFYSDYVIYGSSKSMLEEDEE